MKIVELLLLIFAVPELVEIGRFLGIDIATLVIWRRLRRLLVPVIFIIVKCL